jgi:hypothetical protein
VETGQHIGDVRAVETDGMGQSRLVGGSQMLQGGQHAVLDRRDVLARALLDEERHWSVWSAMLAAGGVMNSFELVAGRPYAREEGGVIIVSTAPPPVPRRRR